MENFNFRAELSDSRILKTVFDAISSIVDEVQIKVDEAGLRVDAIDRSHITFVHLELKRELFDLYAYSEPLRINVDTEELMKVLKRAKADDTVVLSVDEGSFIISFEDEARRTFKIRLIDIEYEAPNAPEMNYPAEIEMPFSLLKNSIQDINIVSEKVRFRADPDKLFIEAEGDYGDVNIEWIHGAKVRIPVRSAFSLEKIKEMLKADKFADSVFLKLGTDMPLSLSLRMAADEGVLSFILAPRIESEED